MDSPKFAVKRLTHSDLTFFKSYFANAQGTKQKAINLDAAVFADLFYPRLSRTNPDRPDKVFFDLTIIGPSGAPAFALARKALIQAKNWRLNGELVDDENDPNRFDHLSPDDLAVFRFEGDGNPARVGLGIIAANSEVDFPAVGPLRELLGAASMVAVDQTTLIGALGGLPQDHQLLQLLPDPNFDLALEDATFGNEVVQDPEGLKGNGRRNLRIVSHEDLSRAQLRNDRVGRIGEELVSDWLDSELAADKIRGFSHASRANAISPYDFEIIDTDGKALSMDVKTTTGTFGRSFHISVAELKEAARGERPYLIYRVYDLQDDGRALMRRSEDIRNFARNVLDAILPAGVSIDSYSVSTDCLKWSSPPDPLG